MDYGCSFHVESDGANNDFALGVNVPVTSLCPCSKEISDYGAHNQRGNVDVQIRSTKDEEGNLFLIWIEEVVELVEQSASAPLYPLLKRPNERHVTMQAYDNPVFVQDLVSNVAVKLKRDERIACFSVEAVNQESIHNHNAFARVEWKRRKQNTAT
jgi:GTP cyclohydrolase IB